MQQQQDDFVTKWKRNFNIGFTLMLIHQRAITILLRSRWGHRALGTPCALALVMMVLWAAFSRDPFLWGWVALWLICFIARRIESVWQASGSQRQHSEYDGWPAAITIGRTEKIAKLIVEPALIGGMGWWLLQVYAEHGWEPYGLPYFLLAGCFSLPFVELVKQEIWKRRSEALVNARLEQEALMQEMREKYGDS